MRRSTSCPLCTSFGKNWSKLIGAAKHNWQRDERVCWELTNLLCHSFIFIGKIFVDTDLNVHHPSWSPSAVVKNAKKRFLVIMRTSFMFLNASINFDLDQTVFKASIYFKSFDFRKKDNRKKNVQFVCIDNDLWRCECVFQIAIQLWIDWLSFDFFSHQ